MILIVSWVIGNPYPTVGWVVIFHEIFLAVVDIVDYGLFFGVDGDEVGLGGQLGLDDSYAGRVDG